MMYSHSYMSSKRSLNRAGWSRWLDGLPEEGCAHCMLGRNRNNRTERNVAIYSRALITSNLPVVINHRVGDRDGAVRAVAITSQPATASQLAGLLLAAFTDCSTCVG